MKKELMATKMSAHDFENSSWELFDKLLRSLGADAFFHDMKRNQSLLFDYGYEFLYYSRSNHDRYTIQALQTDDENWTIAVSVRIYQ